MKPLGLLLERPYQQFSRTVEQKYGCFHPFQVKDHYIFEGVDSHHVCANLEQHRTTRGVNQVLLDHVHDAALIHRIIIYAGKLKQSEQKCYDQRRTHSRRPEPLHVISDTDDWCVRHCFAASVTLGLCALPLCFAFVLCLGVYSVQYDVGFVLVSWI